MTVKITAGFLAILFLALTACTNSAPTPISTTVSSPLPAKRTASVTSVPSLTMTASPSPSASPQPTDIPTQTQSPTFTLTHTPSITLTFTPTHTPSITPTFTPSPTYTKLRGQVTIEQAVCHYGPGAPYLYKYGVYKGSNLELLRRVEGGNYVEIQAIGGNNPCWVRVDYFNIKGNWLDLQPVRFDNMRLPITPYYASPGGVSARRNGSEVTVSWNPLILDPGNDSEQVPYIIEAWVCQGGQNVFHPYGTYQTAVSIVDEPGCAEPSYGYFVAAEKHGYTPRVKVPWPAP